MEYTLTSARYLQLLQNEIIPTLTRLYPNQNFPNTISDEIWFQQDGAPPHYAREVRDHLDTIFPQRWIGRRGHIEWPARSPDLTPLDFFLWGYVKSRVYITKPGNLVELVQRISQEMTAIPGDFIAHAVRGFVNRIHHCQEVNGEQFEHLL